MLRIKFFTIKPPQDETLIDGSLTNYLINNFLNADGIHPVDISAEYNEFTGTILISVAYKESKSLLESIIGRKGYEVRFVEIGHYHENAHTVYMQKVLEDAANYNVHRNISHGIYVEKSMTKAVFLEYK